jgi:hypothetical protein
MPRAVLGEISLWRGTVETRSPRVHTACRRPSRASSAPLSRRCRSRSRRFTGCSECEFGAPDDSAARTYDDVGAAGSAEELRVRQSLHAPPRCRRRARDAAPSATCLRPAGYADDGARRPQTRGANEARVLLRCVVVHAPRIPSSTSAQVERRSDRGRGCTGDEGADRPLPARRSGARRAARAHFVRAEPERLDQGAARASRR